MSKQGHYSVKKLWMISKFEFELYSMMLYPSVIFEWNSCIPSKVFDRNPQFSHNLSKKGVITKSKFCGLSPFQTWSVFTLDTSVKFEWNWLIPSKVKSVTTWTAQKTMETWSICVHHDKQATQKNVHFVIKLGILLDFKNYRKLIKIL